ncbi:hypothetical protein Vadar_003082 [Vaccinium darrowii]|uniref:Uncharacterized protein n=1 Tax=Vaccinium darrowii TaxID=229202 RepID=A0ACB7Y5S7_9ERIC|nr:hypothetical protein Vadar_003082 [Vaccinium darrowii]
MEEVWNDITLASLQDHHHHRHSTTDNNPDTTTTFHGHTLLDFLSNKNPPPQPPPQPIHGGYGSPTSSPAAVALRLNSGPDDHQFDSILQGPVLRPISDASSCLDVSFEGLASSLPCLGRKRVPESDHNSGDRRHKRMIKNRESAARSRARKQAYTNELELEVAHLLEENAKLKKQQEQLSLAAAAQVPKKKSLFRSSTAPF